MAVLCVGRADCLGMVAGVLQYFAARTVPLHVRLIVGYAWFCTISIIVLVPADIWTVSIAFPYLLFAFSYLLSISSVFGAFCRSFVKIYIRYEAIGGVRLYQLLCETKELSSALR